MKTSTISFRFWGLLLALLLAPALALGQSRSEGMALWNEAWKLESTAGTKADLEKALHRYENALAIFEKEGYADGIAGVMINLGKIHFTLGRYDKGLEYYRRVVDIGKKSGNPKTEAKGHSGTGAAHFDLGQYEQAIQDYQKALDLYKRASDREGEGLTFNHIGECYREQGRYTTALEYYQKALDLAKKAGSPEAEADTLHNMGELFRGRGNYAKAMENFQQSLATYRQLQDRRLEGITLCDMASAHRDCGRYTEAAKYYQDALNVLGNLGAIKEQGRTLLELGLVYQNQGRTDEALQSFQKALVLYKQTGVSSGRPAALIGDLYLDKGELDKAADYIKNSGSRASLGRLYLLRRQHAEARAQYSQLLTSAEESGNVEDLFTAHTGLGKAYEALEDYKKAEEHYERGWQMTEEIRSGLAPAERKNFFEVRINGFLRSEPSKGLTRVRMKLNEPEESIAASEASKARALADRLSRQPQQGRTGVPQKILDQEEALVSKLAALKKARSKISRKKNPVRYRNLTREIHASEEELEAFIAILRKEYPAYAAFKHPEPVTLAASALKPEEYVVEFSVSDEGVVVKLIKDKEIAQTSYCKWPLTKLEAAVRKFRECFETKNLRGFNPKLGHQLYSRLLAPVLMEVPEGVPLIIIPDGVLALLPFEALVTAGKAVWKEGERGPLPDGLTYLGQIHPLSYYQSVTYLTLARTVGRKEKAGSRYLVVADPVFSNDDERLRKGAHDERRRILDTAAPDLMSPKDGTQLRFERLSRTSELGTTLQQTFPGQTDLRMGLEARKDLLVGKSLAQYGSIVFATHGYFGNDLPGIQEPVLALTLVGQPRGRDGYLRLSEAMELNLSADVVCLVACQTGLGKQVTGEGVMNMGWAFQYAGAKSVLTSLWEVSEGASIKMFEHFFQAMKAGRNRLEALELARNAIRKMGYEHPYYWASFILVGEAR